MTTPIPYRHPTYSPAPSESARAVDAVAASSIASATPPDLTVATAWLSNAIEHVRADSASGARTHVANGQEPAVVRRNGRFHMLYVRGKVYYSSCPENLDPRVAANWTAEVEAISRAGVSTAHGSLYIEGSTAYYYFVDTGDQNTYVATASTADLSVWTDPHTVVLGPIGNLGNKISGNSYVVKDGATYYMFAEGSVNTTDAAGTIYPWLTYLATATSPLGPFTIGSTPLQSLRPPPNGSVSGSWLTRENGKWVMIYHGQEWGRTGTPTDIYRATATDISADAWTITNDGRPIMTRSHPYEMDQVADPEVCPGPTGIPYLFYSAVNNVSGNFHVMCTQLYPTLTRWTGSKWIPAEPIGGGELPYWNAFVPRVTQNSPHLDPTGQIRTGTWALSTSPAGMVNGCCRTNTSAANGDQIKFDLALSPGTYSLKVVHPKGPDMGIARVDLAYGSKYSVLVIGTIDQYAAEVSANNVATLNFTVDGRTPARAQIWFTVAGKNAASSGYAVADQGWQVVRTDY